jgi:hypothetical protein
VVVPLSKRKGQTPEVIVGKTYKEQVPGPRQGMKMGLSLGGFTDALPQVPSEGSVFLRLTDSRTGEVLENWHRKNLIVRDAGILAAKLFRNSLDPSAVASNGLRMLAVGTGATGNVLSPDAPQATQRALNTEIARKAFASAVFRNAAGIAVAYPTNVVDFTTTFAENEAVGGLNEMALLAPFSSNPLVLNPLPPGPSGYDPTLDVTGKDLMVNYLPFPIVSKPALSVLTITWRLSF